MKKWPLFGLGALVALGYSFINTPHGAVHYLAVLADRRVPFEPIFVIPYLLFLPIFWGNYLIAFITDKNFRNLAWAVIASLLMSYAVYYFYQTGIARPDVLTNNLLNHWVNWVYRHDMPYNEFPSTHVALGVVLAAYYYSIKSKHVIWLLLFSLLVIASTLFIKQHTILGVVGGLVVGLAVSVIWLPCKRT